MAYTTLDEREATAICDDLESRTTFRIASLNDKVGAMDSCLKFVEKEEAKCVEWVFPKMCE